MSAIPVDRSEEQARLLLNSILAMMRRLDHIARCQDPGCGLSDMEILDGLYLRETGRPATESERVKYHNEEDAFSTIRQAYLRLQMFPDGSYELLFRYAANSYGRIVGELSRHYTPVFAKYEYLDNTAGWRHYQLTPAEQEIVYDFSLYYVSAFQGLRAAGSPTADGVN